MTILFNSARPLYPDSTSGGDGTSSEFARDVRKIISNITNAVNTRSFINSFMEDGTTKVPGTTFAGSQISNSVAPLKRSIISQDINATVLVKKRHFSTLANNFDVKYMGEKERLYLRAVKALCRRKCEEISFYESLTYINKIIEDPDFIRSEASIGQIIDAFSIGSNVVRSILDIKTVTGGAPGQELFTEYGNFLQDLAGNPIFKELFNIRESSIRARQNPTTTWITDPFSQDNFETGVGVGVIEFTMIQNITTTVALKSGTNCNIQLQDPYKLSIITEADINQATKEAYLETNRMSKLIPEFERSKQVFQQAVQLDNELNRMRRERGVSEVNFEFTTEENNLVTAVLVNINLPFTEHDQAISGKTSLFVNGRATPEEVSRITDIPASELFAAPELLRVRQIFRLLKEYAFIQRSAVDTFQLLNHENSDLRNRLRQEFVGHSVIQHMDKIHIFANSSTRDETPNYKGQTDQSIFNIDDATDRFSREMIEEERLTIAPSIPYALYASLRDPTTFRGTGPQVWEGVVDSVSTSYSAQSAEYTISIGAKDNLHLFQISRVNTNPGLDQIHGALEDPLTPFDIKTDPDTGLVMGRGLSAENEARVADSIIKFHDNPYLGKTIKNPDDIVHDTMGVDNSSSAKYRHANGLIYKWKSGITSITQSINMRRPFAQSRSTVDTVSEDFGLSTVKNVFSRLDAADIISIIVCGQPYNYNTFIRSAIQAGTLSGRGIGRGQSYFETFFDNYQRVNPIIGQFVPAQDSVLNSERVMKSVELERSYRKVATREGAARREYADQVNILNSLRVPPGTQLDESAQALLRDAEARAKQAQDIALKELSDATRGLENGLQGDLRIFGNNADLAPSVDEINSTNRQLRYAFLKRPELVRYNQDRSYLIISNKYESDVAIQAYIQELRNNGDYNPFENTYQQPLAIMEEVAKRVHFELFADSQGNINFRPPEYNKMPLSLLLRILQLSSNDGADLIPPFIKNAMKGRDKLYRDRILTTDLRIREQVALLGGLANVDNNNGAFGGVLRLVTSREEIPGNLFAYKVDEGSVRMVNADTSVFTADDRIRLLEQESTKGTLDEQIRELMSVRNQLRMTTGRPTEELNLNSQGQRSQLTKEIENANSISEGALKRLSSLNKIAELVGERQKLIIAFEKIRAQSDLINEAEGFSGFSSQISAFLTSLAGPELDQTVGIPEFMLEFIENDLQHFTGRASGRRYIIEDAVILRQEFKIEPPEFTRIDVYGSQNILGEGKQLVKGNPLAFWAGATDFDLWRQFGFREAAPETVMYLTNPETQLAPYAVYRLLQQRGKIHVGSVMVVGNEHYQVGDVVYIVSREMLYYVESVKHNIDMANNAFTTQLSLAYGRPPGQYIPQPFDIIGRTLLGEAERSGYNYSTTRSAFASSSQVRVVGTVFIPRPTAGGDAPGSTAQDAFLSANSSVLKAAARAINREYERASGKDTTVRVEVRGYTISDRTKALQFNASIRKQMGQVVDILKGGLYNPHLQNILEGDMDRLANAVGTIDGLKSQGVPGELHELQVPAEAFNNAEVLIELDKDLDEDGIRYRRMPSQEAWLGSDTVRGGFPNRAIDIVVITEKNSTNTVDTANTAAARPVEDFATA